MAVLTLGLGFAAGNGLGLIIGAAAYALGWIYLPDSKLFKGWVDGKNASQLAQNEQQEMLQFLNRRNRMISGLGALQRQRYQELSAVCAEIESAGSGESTSNAGPLNNPQLKRLDDLMWTYLKMLTIEDSIVKFLNGEEKEDLKGLLRETELELEAIRTELKGPLSDSIREARKRLEQSKNERLLVLARRIEKADQAGANLDLVRAEQDRLEHQIKLVRADAVASRNTASLSTRINATVEQLDHTNRWISEMEEFKDLVGEIPSTTDRVGYRIEPATTVQSARPPQPRIPNSSRN